MSHPGPTWPKSSGFDQIWIHNTAWISERFDERIKNGKFLQFHLKTMGTTLRRTFKYLRFLGEQCREPEELLSISLLGMKEPEAREKRGRGRGGGGRVEKHQEVGSSSREEGGLCLKDVFTRIELAESWWVPFSRYRTYRKANFCLGSINAGSGSWAPGWFLPVGRVHLIWSSGS
jgi:hypothetical protein